MSDSDPSLSGALLKGSLLKGSLLKEAALAPWRSSLARALHRNRSRPYSRYFQLATVTATGHPANRTVVFRDFLPHTNTLTMVTDQRSGKVADIAAHPWAEACWYFTHTREQFRLAGPIQVVGATDSDADLKHARQKAWNSLSDNARQQFYWPHPAQPRDSEAGFSPRDAGDTPPAVFCLVLLTPDRVDHLDLRGDPQTRTLYSHQSDAAWQVKAVNP